MRPNLLVIEPWPTLERITADGGDASPGAIVGHERQPEGALEIAFRHHTLDQAAERRALVTSGDTRSVRRTGRGDPKHQHKRCRSSVKPTADGRASSLGNLSDRPYSRHHPAAPSVKLSTSPGSPSM